jgi:peptide deformylase
MASLPIVRVPEAVLRQKTKKVKKIDESIQKLIDDMIETMHDAPGVGLAANQVGVSLRIAVMQVPGEDVIVLINPEVVKRSGTQECDEGCLSLPGYKGTLTRSEKVVVKGLNRNGRPVRIHADGLLAEIIEHETDHLDGTLYFDYLESIDKLQPIRPGEDEDHDSAEAVDGDEADNEEVAAKGPS